MPDNKELATIGGHSGRQSQGSLFPIKEVEIDGIQMGILSDGSPYLTSRGLGRMCGVHHSAIHRMSTNWAEEQLLPRGVTIKRLLAAQGYFGGSLFIRIPDRGSEAQAYPDAVCMAILEYYAFESPQNMRDVAVRNFRLLARHSFREFIYNRCGYDPNRHIPESWRNFHERVLLNDNIPVAYFSIFRELADIVVHLIQSGCPLDSHTVPDISVGMTWANHWGGSDLDSRFGPRQKHPHNYPEWFPQSKANPVAAWIYPIEALGEFRVWLHENYIKVNFPKYLEAKTKAGVFLPSRAELLLAAVSQKGLAIPPTPPPLAAP